MPAAQSVQLASDVAPAAAPKEPAGQGCGAAPAAQKKPAEHEPATLAEEPGGQLAPAAQAVQVALESAPVAAEKEPLGQGLQTAWPAALSAAKVPALQLVHACADVAPKGAEVPKAQGVPAQAAAPAAAE